ncbi:MAG: hypothetical protein V5804_12830 [Mucilaginibacter sp.]|uniref:hypothetical protein n=1 Tax=Mucilaginibacter sp. TaxID=1882438 RepID=UPI0034E436D9
MKTKIENKISYVEELRSIRDKISLDIQDMSFEQLKEYVNKRESVFPKSCWDKASKPEKADAVSTKDSAAPERA